MVVDAVLSRADKRAAANRSEEWRVLADGTGNVDQEAAGSDRRIADALNHADGVDHVGGTSTLVAGDLACVEGRCLACVEGCCFVDAGLHRRVRRIFRGFRHAGRHDVQVHIGQSRQQGFFIQNRDALEASLPERATALVFLIRKPSQRCRRASRYESSEHGKRPAGATISLRAVARNGNGHCPLHEPAQIVQTLAAFSDPLCILQTILNPGIRDFQRLTILASRRKQLPPPTNRLFIRPASRRRIIPPQNHVQVIIEHRVCTHFDSKDRSQFLQQSSLPPSRTSSSLSLGVAQLLPLFPMLSPLTTKKGPPNTTRNAVVIRSDRRIHQLPTSHRHRKNSQRTLASLSRRPVTPTQPVNYNTCPSFFLSEGSSEC